MFFNSLFFDFFSLEYFIEIVKTKQEKGKKQINKIKIKVLFIRVLIKSEFYCNMRIFMYMFFVI